VISDTFTYIHQELFTTFSWEDILDLYFFANQVGSQDKNLIWLQLCFGTQLDIN